MMMSEAEILQSYQAAKDPRAQIQILTELNACSRERICDILKRNGIDGRTLNGGVRTKAACGTARNGGVLAALSDERRALLARAQQIERLIPQLCREQDEIESKLAALEMAKNCLEAAYAGKGQEVKQDAGQLKSEGQAV